MIQLCADRFITEKSDILTGLPHNISGAITGNSIMCTLLLCSKCEEKKPDIEFSINKANRFRGGKSYACLICERQHRKDYLEKNPHIRDKMNARKRVTYSTPEFKRRQRRRYYEKRYGITPEIYDEMLKQQDGGCAICGRDKAHRTQKYLHVDHNHKTGKVRGLLCVRCNTVIGNSRDSIMILKNAIKYLDST